MDPFTALADPVRRALMQRLSRGAARVVDLTEGHGISRPAISRHLRVLGEAGLVDADDVGRERHYRLVPDALDPVRAWLDDVAPAGRPTAPPIPEHALDGLDLEVRRVGRNRRHTGTAPDTTATKETG
ncbi:ArsR/SmtB family transcription factor [Ornithinimicrobium cavernae]|uniref:ArsR/SmtB family transcription factor n=1 Tax=Ornithinimicrobium cavernae TaxID=2666047 RepID=UPI000D69B1D5|nr:metalloregulator ArsR/SmtB family transcription factor [Ornithinimicrobium cavernae]